MVHVVSALPTESRGETPDGFPSFSGLGTYGPIVLGHGGHWVVAGVRCCGVSRARQCQTLETGEELCPSQQNYRKHL